MSSKKKNKNKNKKITPPATLEAESVISAEEKATEETLEEDSVKLDSEEAADLMSDETDKAEPQPSEEAENDFDKSIETFTSADAESPHKKKGNTGKYIRYAVLAVCAAVFAVSVYYISTNLYSKYKSDKLYAQLKDDYAGDAFDIDGSDDGRNGLVNLLAPDTPPSFTPMISDIIENGADLPSSEQPHTAELAKIRASLESLANINPDIYGWIKVPGTGIDYPIAQTSDNEYYLDHDYTGGYSVNGSIYADYRCEANPSHNKNTVLYGHNITSGSMFHGVEDFFNRDIFENSKIYLYTMDGVFIYEAFSIHEASYDSGYVDTYFETPEDYVAFVESLASFSDIKSEDAVLDENSSIITLSTCTNGFWTKRYALHGVLVNTITE